MGDQKISDLSAGDFALAADYLEFLDVSDTAMAGTGTNKKALLDRLLGLAGVIPGGRLTTESGVGVSTSDRTGQGTVYYTPHAHDMVRLYDGTRVREYVFTERSWSVSISSGQNKDLFLYDNAGTLTIEASAAWSDDVTRTDALAWQAGLGWVKSGTATRLWIGTVRGDGTNTVADSGGGATSQVGAKRFVFNAHNRVARHIAVHDATNTWAYTTNSIRQANGTAGNKVEWVAGDTGTLIDAFVLGPYEARGTTTIGAVGLGLDSTSAFSGVWSEFYNNNGLTLIGPNTGRYTGCPGLGYHYLAWLEQGFTGTGAVFYGDDSGGSQAGIRGFLVC